MSKLEKELSTYRRLLPTFISDQGKYAVINEDKLIGIYSAYEDAVKIGYQTCGLESPFLVKQISSEENILYFSRDLYHSCHA